MNLVINRPDAHAPALQNLRRTVEELRVGATPNVMVADDRPFAEILADSSSDADIVLVGLAEPGNGDYTDYLRSALDRSASMPPTLYVLAAEDLPFGEVLLDAARAPGSGPRT